MIMSGEVLAEYQKFDPSIIFYMNDYSYPIKNNWLKIISSKYKKKE